jgi:hypothetical protein
VKIRHFYTLSMMALAGLLLSGCGLRTIVKMCPVASVLADTESYPFFRPGMDGDPAGEAFNAKIVGVTTDCDYDARLMRSDSDAEVMFRATRTPTGEAATYSVPYFLAVTYAGEIRTKKNFSVEFTFAPGASTAEFSQDVESIVNQVEPGKLPFDYQILVGMQLSEAQMNYNKLMGRYTP